MEHIDKNKIRSLLKRFGLKKVYQYALKPLSFIETIIIRMTGYSIKPPKSVQIETTIRCNLSCYMCPRETLGYKDRNIPDMNLKQFIEIIDKLPKGVKTVYIHGLGEPLLNENIVQMVDYASRRFDIGIVTNGTLFNSKLTEDILLTSPVNITISFDSADQETYEEIRRGARYDDTIRNINTLVKLQGRISPSTKLSMNMVVSEKNFNQIKNMILLCSNVGIKNLTVIGTHTNSLEKMSKFLPGYKMKVRELKQFAEDNNINFDLVNIDFKDEKRREICNRPWKSIYINCDGTVNPCCIHESNKVYVVGSIFEVDFGTIWNGQRMRSFRMALFSDNKPNICVNCDQLYW